MCGRYSHVFTWEQLHDLMELLVWPEIELSPRYNVAPTQKAPIVRSHPDAGREGALLRWGLVPFWAKDEKIGNRMINARAESAASKPAFRQAFRSRRCLVPASGFYEWKPVKGRSRKQPYYFQPAQGPILAFAGLWERWDKGPGAPMETFTILTTDPNDVVRPVHDRMPVVLPEDAWGDWLATGESDPARLASLLVPCAPSLLASHPVGTQVNSPANDDPSLVEPSTEAQDDLSP